MRTTHKHDWVIEPVTQTQPLVVLHMGHNLAELGEIDGELYTADYRRQNLRATCRTCDAGRTFNPKQVPRRRTS